jgi:nitrite reductase/ring-hydroxylating ferredoxin subunit/multimeric flavodoxin WrbA
LADPDWHDLGAVSAFSAGVTPVTVGRTKLAVTLVEGVFGVIGGSCNHAGGPLGEGRIDGEYVVCPWHNWKYHARTGQGEPGFEADRVPSYAVKVEGARVLVDLASATKRQRAAHAKHPLDREPVREPGGVRVLGISTTSMDPKNPRYSTSDDLLLAAIEHAAGRGLEAKTIRLSDLSFRSCEGYYSKSSRACTWPCSITQMDAADQLDRVYEAMIFWADVVVVSTPIRWGNASALYYKMVERMNCVQNQMTLRERALIRKKTAAFIVTGGQDNVQAVAGQMLGFFAELGFVFPPFPYIAHSRGWSAEDMENNIRYVKNSGALRDGARGLVDRAVTMAQTLLHDEAAAAPMPRAGRKADGMERRSGEG